jgi:ketosteroid isomerase-like protein
MTMTAREAFEKGTATFNAHDLDGFKEVLADDVVFKAPGGMHGEGKAACAAFFGSWFAAFPNARVEVEAVHIVDDIAVEEGTFTGTQNGVLHGPTGDIPPTGRSVEVNYVQVLRFRGGKHVSFNLMFDRLTMLEQLGLVPTSAVAA